MRDMAYDPQGQDVYPEPERTSLAAILGFLFSLGGCCLAGIPALLGLPISVAALVTIGRSNGRLGGRGLAVAGVILGLISIVAWGSCLGAGVFSLGAIDQRTLDPTERVFVMLKEDNLDGVRANLLSPAADATDAELLAFRAAYRSTLGDYVDRPRGMGGYVGSISRWGPWQSVLSTAPPGSIPALFTFEQGDALVLISIDQQTGQPTALTVYDGDLNEYTLPLTAPLETPTPPADTNPAVPPIPDPSAPETDPADAPTDPGLPADEPTDPDAP